MNRPSVAISRLEDSLSAQVARMATGNRYPMRLVSHGARTITIGVVISDVEYTLTLAEMRALRQLADEGVARLERGR